MTGLLSTTPQPTDAEQRSNSLRAFWFTLVITSLLLLQEPVRTIVSVEATVAAITLGVVTGITTSVVLGLIQFESQNDVRTTVVTLVLTGITTIVLWILLPPTLLQTVPQFGLAFMWSFSLVSVARDVLWPKATEVVTPHE
ncbi:hypothetical protein [Haladaptatus sp. AB643]|uniref:hypothetical protein n=1 Tax=Haladaptatus sp. AB643 TaxID=2934174 RepID=UPI00209C36E0|nr:hypothetical protein [Haladaptatus sp. AB643]MCO8242889.1 hypothetical protein [Haladaptatus sp. AB643]